MRKTGAWLLFSAGWLSACAKEVKVDANETQPIAKASAVQFDPGRGVVPFPNNLVRNPATGRVALPQQCGESPIQTNLRAGVLNSLNGFASLQPVMRITFDQPVDVASIGLGTASQRIKLLKRATGSVPTDPSSAATVPFVVIPGTQKAFSADCASSVDVPNLTLVTSLLDSASTYDVVVLSGLKATDGTEFNASATWAFVRQEENPVTIQEGVITRNSTPFDPSTEAGVASIRGLDLLWKAHARAMGFLAAVLAPAGITRDQVLLAFEFTTQDNRSWANPEAGLLASSVDSETGEAVSTAAVVNVVGGAPSPVTVQQVFEGASPGLCGLVSCNLTLSHYIQGEFTSPLYQPEDANGVPTQFSDAYAPTQVGTHQVKFIAFVPAAPLESYRTVIFGHGFTRKKEDLFALASQFAAKGIATVAMDWPLLGERAVQTVVDEELGCPEGADPTEATQLQCFAPILSLNLAATRDNFRQGVVDAQQLARVMAACGTENCGPLKVDAERIGYLGQSLGSLLGSSFVANTPEIKTAVLNVGAGLWVDVLLNSQRIQVICPIVNGLIDSGLLTGAKYPEVGALCLEDTWRTHPATLQFAGLARWILDPSDGANFIRLLASPAAPRVLFQEVVGDEVVPNVTTSNFAALLGLAPVVASTASAVPATPSPLATESNHAFLRYVTETGVNEFEHGSLLAPIAGIPGSLGTAQMQSDAISFLDVNL